MLAPVRTASPNEPGRVDAVPGALPAIVLEAVGKRFLVAHGEHAALRGVDLRVQAGEFVCLLGPSGCGKTTLLRILAGLERHSEGRVCIHEAGTGRPLTSVVFQEQSVFPWMNVRDNVAYGLRARGVAGQTLARQVDYYLAKVGLECAAQLYPHQLSGGMKQRVSIARAFANDPEILLMDEPFSALDEQNRATLQEELLRIWSETGKTVVFITHSIDEAIFLGDRVVVMGGPPGRVLAEIPVPFQRPRQYYALKARPEYGALVLRIAELIRTALSEQGTRSEGSA